MPVLILTGPSAAGKNKVAYAIAKLLPRCAVIDVDVVRHMVVSPGQIPNAAGVELIHAGRLQSVPQDYYEGDAWRPGVRAVVALARQLIEEGFAVIVVDVLSDASAAAYRQALAALGAVNVVLLLPSLAEVRRRYRDRAKMEGSSRLGDEALIDLLHEHQEHLASYDQRIDNTKLEAEEIATSVVKLIA